MTISREEYLELKYRVDKLEEKRNKECGDRLLEAIDEFMYMDKTEAQQDAWNIIFPIIKNEQMRLSHGSVYSSNPKGVRR